MTHTPGEWVVSKSGRTVHAGSLNIKQIVGPCAASVAVERANDEILKANARLIAAAPEMLDALEGALERLESYQIMGPERAAVERAIKKAKGE